jgi:hypothetical protein
LTGFTITAEWDLWDRFLSIHDWWIHAMVGVWLVFTIMLFVAEPLFLHRWFHARAKTRPAETFRLIVGLHWFLLAISLITVVGATAGSHGATF